MNKNQVKKQIVNALTRVIKQRHDNPYGSYWAILYVSIKDNYYMQFIADTDNELEVEISGSHYDSKRFTEEQLKIIEGYGYKYPQKSIPNFHKIVNLLTTSVESVRDEIFDILLNVLDLENNLPLKIEFEYDEKWGKDTWLRRFVRTLRRGRPFARVAKLYENLKQLPKEARASSIEPLINRARDLRKYPELLEMSNDEIEKMNKKFGITQTEMKTHPNASLICAKG